MKNPNQKQANAPTSSVITRAGFVKCSPLEASANALYIDHVKIEKELEPGLLAANKATDAAKEANKKTEEYKDPRSGKDAQSFFDSSMERSLDSAKSETWGVQVFNQPIMLDEKKVKLYMEDDPFHRVVEFIIDKSLKAIIECARQNMKEVKALPPSDMSVPKEFDLDLSGLTHETKRMRLWTRIMALSNLIPVRGRMGPATFVMMSEKMENILNGGKTYSKVWKRDDNPYSGGLTTLICEDLKDEILVGRMAQNDQTGVHAFVKEGYEQSIIFKGAEMDSVIVELAVEKVGPNAHKSYAIFKVKDTNGKSKAKPKGKRRNSNKSDGPVRKKAK